MNRHAEGEQRAAIIEDARALLDWLEANPEVPVWAFGQEILCSPDGGRAGVDRVASVMGEKPEERPNGAYRATKRFGRVAYVSYAAPQPKAVAA